MGAISRRSFGLFGTAGALAWASGAAAAAPATGAFDLAPYVNPELRPMLGAIRKFASDADLTPETLVTLRKTAFAPPPLAAPAWTERSIAGAPGSPPVRVYVINAGAPGGPLRPAILHTHGGGFVLQSARDSIRSLQQFAAALDCVIVTVDYRLAPETRFSGSLDDNYAGLKWLHDNAEALGVDRTRLAVMGESAGGGHAAMLAIAARDRGEVPLVYQALIYPMLDDRTGSIWRKPPYMGAVVWNEQKNRFGWSSLLGVPAGSTRVPYGSVPGRVEDLRGLPPAFIGVGSIDLFVDEDIAYARRLLDAGVPVTLNVVPGAFHGFDLSPAPIAKRFNASLLASLADALKPPSR